MDNCSPITYGVLKAEVELILPLYCHGAVISSIAIPHVTLDAATAAHHIDLGEKYHVATRRGKERLTHFTSMYFLSSATYRSRFEWAWQ